MLLNDVIEDLREKLEQAPSVKQVDAKLQLHHDMCHLLSDGFVATSYVSGSPEINIFIQLVKDTANEVRQFLDSHDDLTKEVIELEEGIITRAYGRIDTMNRNARRRQATLQASLPQPG